MGLSNPTHIFLIALVIVLLFGAKRLPEIGGAMGKGIREFKRSMREVNDEIERPAPPPEQRRIQAPEDQQRLS